MKAEGGKRREKGRREKERERVGEREGGREGGYGRERETPTPQPRSDCLDTLNTVFQIQCVIY